jgi:hypothetical protein
MGGKREAATAKGAKRMVGGDGQYRNRARDSAVHLKRE